MGDESGEVVPEFEGAREMQGVQRPGVDVGESPGLQQQVTVDPDHDTSREQVVHTSVRVGQAEPMLQSPQLTVGELAGHDLCRRREQGAGAARPRQSIRPPRRGRVVRPSRWRRG